MERKILLTDCHDETGIIANVTSICSKYRLNIVKNTEFVAHEQERFFMRTVLEGDFNSNFLSDVRAALPDGASARLVSTAKKRLVVMVTKESHCLGDLLLKHYAQALNLEIVAVIGNYDVLRELTEKFNIPRSRCPSVQVLTMKPDTVCGIRKRKCTGCQKVALLPSIMK